MGKKKDISPGVRLSTKEIAILCLICDELTSIEIGEKLNINYRTVESHRKNIMKMIGARNVVGLTKYAIKKGLYSIGLIESPVALEHTE